MKDLLNSEGARRALLCSTPCPFSLLTSAKDARYSSSAVRGRAHTAFASLPRRHQQLAPENHRAGAKAIFFFFCLFFLFKTGIPSDKS